MELKQLAYRIIYVIYHILLQALIASHIYYKAKSLITSHVLTNEDHILQCMCRVKSYITSQTTVQRPQMYKISKAIAAEKVSYQQQQPIPILSHPCLTDSAAAWLQGELTKYRNCRSFIIVIVLNISCFYSEERVELKLMPMDRQVPKTKDLRIKW